VIALDTNVLARLLLDDEPQQAQHAERLLAAHADCWIPVTVLLELAWVLRSAGYDRARVVHALSRVIAMTNVRPQNPEAVRRALAWSEAGVDIADALHLALSPPAEIFATFNADLVAKAAQLALTPKVRLP
jgi:predicted nucleic acid-binding protein